MALTKAQFMEYPGGVIPVGAVKAGTGISIADGVMAVDPNGACFSLKPGDATVTIDPPSGVGTVTVNIPPQNLQDPVVNPGDKMFFFNSAAPSGWTKDTSNDNLMIRVVTGAGGGVGGASPFTSAFTTYTPQGGITGVVAAGTVQSATINQGELPSHTHGFESRDCAPVGINPVPGGNLARCQQAAQSSGGNGAHTHSFSGTITGGFIGQTTNQFTVQYIDMILCTKN